jgi:hypothetical protein
VKPSTSTNVIARRGSNALGIPVALSRGGRGLLATPSGAVACELEATGIDAEGARYQLRVTNGTGGVLAATASAHCVDEDRPIAALAVEIAPHAAIRTGFVLDPALAYERVSAEVHGDGVHLVVEAAPPGGKRRRRRWVAPVVALAGAALLAGATLIVFGAERPRVVDVALLGSPDGQLLARWSMTGNGSRSYELRDARGQVIAQGPLAAAAGSMPVGRNDAASLHVAVANSFGSDARDAAYVRATAPPAIRIPATPPPRIDRLAIDAPRANEPLRVHYVALARDVHLAVLDRSGAVWFSTTTPTGSGVVQIPAPPAGPREPYQLVVRAEGQGAGEETRVPLPAAVAETASPPPLAPLASQPGVAVQRRAASNTTVVDAGGSDSFGLRPYPVHAGQTFVVDVPSGDGARVQVVSDRDGIELYGADLRSGSRHVEFTAPGSPGKYTVRVTLRRGYGLETLVRPLRFAP